MPCITVNLEKKPSQPAHPKSPSKEEVFGIPTEYLEIGAAVGVIALLGLYLSRR